MPLLYYNLWSSIVPMLTRLNLASLGIGITAEIGVQIPETLKDQIIEYDVSEQKIYSYPVAAYIQALSERTRDQTARDFAEAKKRQQFILFVKDTPNRRLRSYIFDMPK